MCVCVGWVWVCVPSRYRREPWAGLSTHKIYAKLLKGQRPPFKEPQPPGDLKAIIESMWSQVTPPPSPPPIHPLNGLRHILHSTNYEVDLKV